MKEQKRKSNIDGLPVLLLFAVFTVLILMVLLTGADAVQKLSDRDQRSYDARTAMQYIVTRVRQADRAGGIEVRDFMGCDALVLSEDYDGVTYETMIYCHDGHLKELFAEAGLEQEPAYGEEVLPAEELHITLDGAWLRFTLALDEAEPTEMTLVLRSGEEAEA